MMDLWNQAGPVVPSKFPAATGLIGGRLLPERSTHLVDLMDLRNPIVPSTFPTVTGLPVVSRFVDLPVDPRGQRSQFASGMESSELVDS